MCVCVWVFLFFCGYSAFVTLLALCLSLPLSFWLIKWLSNAEWVCCWVACRLSAGQLSAALECCCFRARNISMSFTICLVYYCRSSFRFSVLVFFFVSLINAFECSVSVLSLCALFFPHFAWFYLILYGILFYFFFVYLLCLFEWCGDLWVTNGLFEWIILELWRIY